MSEKPFEGVAESREAGYADDLRDFSYRHYGFEDWIGLVLLWIMGALVFTQFFSRYALNDSVAWTEEASRYLLIVLTFIGSAGAVRRGTHIRVESLELALPLGPRKVLWAIQDACRLAFWAFGAWMGVELAQLMGTMPMDSLDGSLAWVYWPVAFGFGMMTLREVLWIRRRWVFGDAPSSQDVVA